MNKNYTYGVECEYSITDNNGNPQVQLDGEDTFNVFMQELHKPAYKEFKEHGKFVPECLSHMVEFNTAPGKIENVISHAEILHQIVEEITHTLGLKISDKQPPLPKECYSPKAVFPKNYTNEKDYMGQEIGQFFADAVNTYESHEPGLAYNIGTTSLHVHFSTGNNEDNFKLWGMLAKKVSQEIRDNPKTRYKKYGMSDDRFGAWSRLVEKRKLLIGDVVGRLDDVLSINGNYREFILDRFFKKNGLIIDPKSQDYILTPNRDHWGFSIKQPAKGVYTVESRLADGPCNNINKIRENVELANNNLMAVLETTN